MWNWFFGEKTYTVDEVLQTLKYFRYLSNNEFTVKFLKDLLPKYPGIHKRFMHSFENGEIMESNVDLLKRLMNEWPEDLAPEMAFLLKAKNVVAGMAIGTEKSTYSEKYFHLVRNILQMTLQDFRKYIVEIRKTWDVVARTWPSTQSYSICLYNEPLNITITHPLIYTYYKKSLKLHEHVYDPIEINVPHPLTDLTSVLKGIPKRPVVVICSSIGPGVVVPDGVWLVFTETTQSYGPRIVPFFHEKGHSVLKNLLDFCDAL